MRHGAWILAAAFVGLAVLFAATDTFGRIKLVTLPKRERIDVRLEKDNYTLCEEERTLTLQQGRNKVDFSWANTYIDKGSIQFRVISAPGKVNVLSVSYPPGENALVWTVSSEKAGPAKIRISYLIANFNRYYTYRAVADRKEKQLTIRCYLKMHNTTGERFIDANIYPKVGGKYKRSLENGEAKLVLAKKLTKVAFDKIYEFDASRRKETEMRYIIKNDKQHNLGLFTMPPGKVRIYQDDGHGGVAFLGEDWGKTTPTGEEMKLFLGLAKDVVIKKKRMSTEKVKKLEPRYDLKEVYRFSLENFKKKEVLVRIVEHPRGQWDIEDMKLKVQIGEDTDPNKKEVDLKLDDYVKKVEKKDISNVILHIKLPPTTKEKKFILYYTLYERNRW
jgi:hypothetical protein